MPPLHGMPSWRAHGKSMVVTTVCLGLLFFLTLNELLLLPTDHIPKCHVILQTRTIISLNGIIKLIFVMETQHVFSEIGTESLSVFNDLQI